MGRTRKKKSMKDTTLEDKDIYDQVDAFHNSKDKVTLEQTEEVDSDVEDVDPALAFAPANSDEEEQEEDYEDDQDSEGAANEDEGDEGDQGGEAENAWGRSKKQYFGADTHDIELHSDDEAAREEEEESKRLQNQMATQLNEEDVGDETLEELIANEKSKKKNKKQKKKSKKPVALLGLDTSIGGDVEAVEKDLNALTPEQKLDLIISDAPELLGLLEDFTSHIKSIREQLVPTVEKLRENALPTDKGLSFYEMKLQALLSYCTNIAFYLLLKAEGKSVKGHPVITSLVKLRTVLEKIRPIDNSLKYQVEKLLKAASTPGRKASDPLSFKPRPGALVNDAEGGEVEEYAEDDGVYRPPKLAAVPYDADFQAGEKRRARADKLKAKASKSSLVAHLREELLFADRPEESSYSAGGKERAEDKEIRAYEEDNWMRINETVKAKKKRKRAQRVNAMEDLGDFGDLDTSALEAFDAKQGQERAASRLKAKKRKQVSFDDGMDEEELAAGLNAYKEATNAVRYNKAKRKDTYKKPESLLSMVDPDEKEGRRMAGNKIVGNRGLTRMRNRELKNPRVKHREKFRKAGIKRRSQVQDYAGQQTQGYGGAKSGIKKNLTRSVRL